MVSGENYPAHVIVVVFLVRDCKKKVPFISSNTHTHKKNSIQKLWS